MQDEKLSPKSVPRFTLEPNSIKPVIAPFTILPERPAPVIYPATEKYRQRAFAEFSQSAEFNSALTIENDQKQIPSHTQAQTSSSAQAQIAELLANTKRLLSHNELTLARVLTYQVLKLDPNNLQALKYSLRFLNLSREIDQVIFIQKRICELAKCYSHLRDLAHFYYKAQNDELALNCYFEAINFVQIEDTSLFEVYKNIGNILTRAGDFDGAEEFFHKAFTINPDSDILSVNLGTLSIQRSDFDSALKRFRQAVLQNPKNDKAWVGLALVHQEFSDPQLAFGNLESALDLNPLNRTAVHLYVNWCVRESRHPAAIEVLSRYLGETQNDEELSLVLIHLFCKTNQFELAQLELERLLLWNPKSEPGLAIEKELLEQRGGVA